MMSDRAGDDDRDENDDGGEAAADETTEVAETQFATQTASGTNKKTVKSAHASSRRRNAAAAPPLTKSVLAEEAAAEELAGAGPVGSSKTSPREKRLEAQLVLVSRPPFSPLGPASLAPGSQLACFGATSEDGDAYLRTCKLKQTQKALADYKEKFAKLSELRTTKAEMAEMRLREIADERQKGMHRPYTGVDMLSTQHLTSRHHVTQPRKRPSRRTRPPPMPLLPNTPSSKRRRSRRLGQKPPGSSRCACATSKRRTPSCSHAWKRSRKRARRSGRRTIWLGASWTSDTKLS